MGYRYDSDIYFPYLWDMFRDRSGNLSRLMVRPAGQSRQEFHLWKAKLVAARGGEVLQPRDDAARRPAALAIVSSCHNRRRLAFLAELARRFNTTLRGGCFDFGHRPTTLGGTLVAELSKQHLFMVSLERARCRHYCKESGRIRKGSPDSLPPYTEKLWRPLSYGMVPVRSVARIGWCALCRALRRPQPRRDYTNYTTWLTNFGPRAPFGGN
eukprot:gene50582-5857_t